MGSLSYSAELTGEYGILPAGYSPGINICDTSPSRTECIYRYRQPDFIKAIPHKDCAEDAPPSRQACFVRCCLKEEDHDCK